MKNINMETFFIFLFIFFLFLFNLLIQWLFSYKIFLLSKQKFLQASFYGAASTTLAALFFGIISLQFLIEKKIWILLVESLALAVSTYIGTIITPIINEKILKRADRKKNKIN